MIKKLSRALSCFLPLFMVLVFKNSCALYDMHRAGLDSIHACDYIWNWCILVLWITQLGFGSWGTWQFMEEYHMKTCRRKKEKEISQGQNYILVKAEDITADFYFTYFSLFVLSFYGIDPTQLWDVLVFLFIEALMVRVYIVGDMYFINPLINLLGYRTFRIEVKTGKEASKELTIYKVFSKDVLSRYSNREVVVQTSEYGFSVCFLNE